MKKLAFSVFLALLSICIQPVMANSRGNTVANVPGAPVSADQFIAAQRDKPLKSPFSTLKEGEERPPLFTYELRGQASFFYNNPNQWCTYGGYPTEHELTVLLQDPSVSLLDEDGPLALLHCPDRDIVVRVKKGPYQGLLQAYAAPNASVVQKGGKIFSTTLSSWPLRNSSGYERAVLSATYIVITNQTDGIRLTHNGAEAFVSMSPEKLFELTGLAEEDMKCQTEVVSLMIPLNRTGYFPGETGDAYVSALLGELLQGNKVDLRDRVEIVSCNDGLYNVLVPVFSSGMGGSS